MQVGARPHFLPGPSASRLGCRVCLDEPPRGTRRYRAWNPPGGVPSSRWLPSSLPPHLTVLRQSSHSAHLPGASALLLCLTSVRRTGDQAEADVSAGRQPDRRNRRPSHPVAARPPRPGRDGRGRREGNPVSSIPQPRRGRQRVSPFTTRRVLTPPARAVSACWAIAGCAQLTVACARGGNSRRRQPTSLAPVCPRRGRKLPPGPPDQGLGLSSAPCTRSSRVSRTPQTTAPPPSLPHFSRWTRPRGAVEIGHPSFPAHRGARGLS